MLMPTTDLCQCVRHMMRRHALVVRQIQLVIALVESVFTLAQVPPATILNREIDDLCGVSEAQKRRIIPRAVWDGCSDRPSVSQQAS